VIMTGRANAAIAGPSTSWLKSVGMARCYVPALTFGCTPVSVKCGPSANGCST
jgi:hypothetical protein